LKLDARNETEGGPLRAVAKIGRERH
jgi:hypothetical protein